MRVWTRPCGNRTTGLTVMRLASLMLVAIFSYMPDASFGASALELVFRYMTR